MRVFAGRLEAALRTRELGPAKVSLQRLPGRLGIGDKLSSAPGVISRWRPAWFLGYATHLALGKQHSKRIAAEWTRSGHPTCGTHHRSRSAAYPLLMNKSYFVGAEWDDEAAVWVADSDDVPGLVTDSAALRCRLQPDLDGAKFRAGTGLAVEASGMRIRPPWQRRSRHLALTAQRDELPSRPQDPVSPHR